MPDHDKIEARKLILALARTCDVEKSLFNKIFNIKSLAGYNRDGQFETFMFNSTLEEVDTEIDQIVDDLFADVEDAVEEDA